ncbi:MAG TPA: rhodanese-like domain-containing protein [Saprospiraceae bacterium]|nr:rhodanese-like domain-containing protein [Saprospiraceae bacterium]
MKLSAVLSWLIFWSACSMNGHSQTNMHCQNPAFDKEVRDWLSFTVPLMDVQTLEAMPRDSIVLLDAREPEEFAISHIPGAKCIGYKAWDKALLQNIPKDKPIVVYCSIGYRSEKIAEKITRLGYTQVKNLYGSIFEWVNQGFPVEDESNHVTQSVHGFNEKWSKWILNPAIKKVW